MEQDESFFDFAAEVGFTKHMGGIGATDEIAELCQIGEASYVLDVGCGAGVTACYLAKEYGCRVVGVDILAKMVERSRERAVKLGVEDRVEFRVADAQELPFEDEIFDTVLTESVTAFPKDKPKAVKEYARVTKTGGYVALNESSWLKAPPPPEIAAWVSQDTSENAEPLTVSEWSALLEQAGLKDILVRTQPIDVGDEAKEMLRRYGCRGMLGVWWRMFLLYTRNSAYRRFLKGLRNQGIRPNNVEQYLGYGLYVGRK
jgi:arsenite methyltransferase